jgi:archaellum biogenesis protein FlaJ (TadC family)
MMRAKKILLSAAVYISAADSKIKQSEKKMLISLAHKLSLSTDEINKTIESIRRNMSLEEEADESENNENIDSEWMCSWCGEINEAGTRFCSRCNEPNRLLKQTGQ